VLSGGGGARPSRGASRPSRGVGSGWEAGKSRVEASGPEGDTQRMMVRAGRQRAGRMAEAGGDRDVLSAPQDGWSPLHTASGNGHLAVVEALLAKGADVEAKDNVSIARACALCPSRSLTRMQNAYGYL
jgi:hypothetical protein